MSEVAPWQGAQDPLAVALADLGLAVAREAAALLLSGRAGVAPVATKSSRHDLVTEMDRASELLIRARITAARPADTVLGEEGGLGGAAGSPAAGSVRWVVDPLDGTVNYVYGQPSWAVSIAAEVDGRGLVGVVVAPALGEQYVGVAGVGSWVRTDAGWEVLRCSQVSRLADALVSTGFGYVADRRRSQGRVVAELLPRVRDIRRVGAAAVDLCWVARGRLDAHYERGLNPWDLAAGAVIAEAAGVQIGGLSGAPAGSDLSIAAPPAFFAELAHALAGLGADTDG